MAQVITLACGHPWEVPAGSGPTLRVEDVICPLCGTGFPAPPPPRPVPSAVHALGALLSPAAGASASAAALPAVPGYEVLGELGRGGMGVVYLARQLGLNRLVALKMIAPGVMAGPRELDRFRVEAESVARLRHPNIVQIHDVGEWRKGEADPPVPYFALEFVDGGSLDRRLNGNPLRPREAAQLVETLARAVQVAHAHGIVHRDLAEDLQRFLDGRRQPGPQAQRQPPLIFLSNILVQETHHQDTKGRKEDEKGQPKGKAAFGPSGPWGPLCPSGLPAFSARCESFFPKITDFGIAKRIDVDSGPTRSGDILGTPSYMAPEQARGHLKEIGPHTDVHALGAILYECLTGRAPFRGASSLETLEQVRSQEPVPPRQLQPKCPRDLETICLKCLRKDPGKRYASAPALAEDLQRFLDGRPIRARPVGQLGRFARWCRRSPVVASLSGGLFVTLALGLVLVSWNWYEADRQRRRAEGAEAKATAEAAAEVEARKQAEQAEEDISLALNFVSATNLARTFSRAATSKDPAALLAGVSTRPEAVRAHQEVCKVGEMVLRRRPNGAVQGTLVKTYAELSVLQAAQGRRDEAARSARRGVELLDPEGGIDAALLGTHEELGQAAFVLGALLMNLSRHEEAITPFRQAVAHQGVVLEAKPKDAKARKVLSTFYYHLAHVQLEANHRDESAATALGRQKLWPDNADEVYDVACEVARCAARVGRGKAEEKLTPQEQQERGRYADQAVSVLRQAVALGLKDAAAVKRDPDLKPLQARDDFQKLVAEMAARERQK
jgi:serine/threonine protein kinase